jgi:hypothetical protein
MQALLHCGLAPTSTEAAVRATGGGCWKEVRSIPGNALDEAQQLRRRECEAPVIARQPRLPAHLADSTVSGLPRTVEATHQRTSHAATAVAAAGHQAAGSGPAPTADTQSTRTTWPAELTKSSTQAPDETCCTDRRMAHMLLFAAAATCAS